MKTTTQRGIGAAAITAGLLLGAASCVAPAHASPLNIVDNGDGTAYGFWTVPKSTWPQPAADPNGCGTDTIQRDLYPYGTPEEIAHTNGLAADALLEYGEDFGWAISWTTYLQPACTTPTEEPSSTPTPSSTPSVPITTPSTPPVSPTTSPTPSSPVPSPSPTVSAPSTSPSPSETATPPTVPSSSPSPTAPAPTSKPSSPPATTAPSPSATPTGSSTPTPTNTSAPSSLPKTAATQTPSPTSATATEKQLASTGTNTAPLFGGAVALLTLGGIILAATRRRNS